jgi:rRNA maturation protein Nop10
MCPDPSRFTAAPIQFFKFLIFGFLLVERIGCNSAGSARSIADTGPSIGLCRTNIRGGYSDDNDTHKKTSRLLRYWLDDEGKRVYTVRKVDPFGRPTFSAYPARFSPRQ